MARECEIAVVGAGVVGLSCALYLAEAGREVLLIAPEDDETGASYGNAGVIADYAVLPLGTPDVLRNLPKLLFDRDSPLALRPRLALAPWLMRFARECLPRRAEANGRAIAALTAEAAGEWRSLAAQIGAEALLKPLGSLYLFETEADQRATRLAPYHAHGVAAELIDRDMLGQLQPGLPESVGRGAVFFPNTITLDDPHAMLRHLRHAVAAAGIARLNARAQTLERLGHARVALRTDRGPVRARRVVLAAGAWSDRLAAQAGDPVPLETERGYHLEYDMAHPRLIRQMTPVARGFYFCPMAGRLRIAGTVELGGRDAPASPRRWEMLERGARAILPDLPAPDRRWMGCRPSLPDSRPVIGPSSAGAEVIHAFGHGHLGLTLAPITARLVRDVITGRAPGLDLAPYRPNRF